MYWGWAGVLAGVAIAGCLLALGAVFGYCAGIERERKAGKRPRLVPKPPPDVDPTKDWWLK